MPVSFPSVMRRFGHQLGVRAAALGRTIHHRRRRRRDAPEQARRLAVLHVPKSAGSSVGASLHGVVPPERWAPFTFDAALFGSMKDEPVPPGQASQVLWDPDELKNYDGVSGHFALPTLRRGFDVDDVILLLREPRARLLSHYEYWRGLPTERASRDNTWSIVATAREMSFSEWISAPSVAYQTDNVVVRMLLAGDPRIPDDDMIDPTDLPGLARRAERVVASIGHTDVVERRAAMWQALGDRVGRSLVEERVNVTNDHVGLPIDPSVFFRPETVRTLAARTAGDQRVYHAVARRAGVADPAVLADTAWMERLGQVVGGA